jgi:hypothetical protein
MKVIFFAQVYNLTDLVRILSIGKEYHLFFCQTPYTFFAKIV